MMNPLLSLLLCYLLGSIPFGLIFTRIAGHKDIRSVGSGNIGATNVFRTTNKFLGILTLLCDAGKGALAVWIIHPELRIYAALVAALGHIFPVWLKFHGGKGVATAFGALLLLNCKLFVITGFVWLVAFLITRTSFISAICSFIVLPIAAYFIGYDKTPLGIMVLISALVIIRHYKNIKDRIKK
jgi:glycerol-3-phosphate acyltransferase PlsY